MTVQAEESIADSIEAKYAKRLAANEKKIRDKAFNELKSYLIKKSMEADGGFTRLVDDVYFIVSILPQ